MSKFTIQGLLIFVACFSILKNVDGQNVLTQMFDQDANTIAYQYVPLKQKRGPHPDFILPSIHGDDVIQLSDYRGKKVLLLHFASW